MRYRFLPTLLLALYALCAICPGRLLPAQAAQADEAGKAHDCHKESPKTDTDCRAMFVESLPAPTETLSYIWSAHALVPWNVFDPPPQVYTRLRPIHFSTAGPQIASLGLNLRI